MSGQFSVIDLGGRILTANVLEFKCSVNIGRFQLLIQGDVHGYFVQRYEVGEICDAKEIYNLHDQDEVRGVEQPIQTVDFRELIYQLKERSLTTGKISR